MKPNPQITKFANAFNLCEKNGVRIYQNPTTSGSYKQKARVKLVIEYPDGRKIISDEDYNQDSVHDKIFSMYVEEASKLH